jgi:hypothetical protein
MKNYEITTIDNDLMAVMSTTYIRPIDCKLEIEKELQSRCYNGTVIFDLLLSNGDEFNRFAQSYFDGCKFGLFEIIDRNLVNVNKFNQFYKHNIKYLQ